MLLDDICPHCGGKISRHGVYYRKKAGVLIQRYKCCGCGRTFSFLPPFLLPHKHYAVSDMAEAIEEYVLGEKGQVKTYQEQETAKFSLETFRRWTACFMQMAPSFLKKARKLLAEIKPCWRYEKDKRLFNADVSDVKKGLYQLFILRDYFTFLPDPEDWLPWLIFQSRLPITQFTKSTRFEADGRDLKRDNKPKSPT